MPQKTVSNEDVECSNTTTPDYGIITTKKKKKINKNKRKEFTVVEIVLDKIRKS